MLKNLLTTALLQMGVATATPVYNAQSIVQDYTLNLTKNNETGSATYNQTINNTGIQDYDIGMCSNKRWNITGGNTYLNVIGNQYQTTVMNTTAQNNVYYYRSYFDRNNINTTYKSGQIVIVLEITPYNYNIETQINLDINLNLEAFYNPETWIYSLVINNAYMQRNLYATTQEDWSTYIDRQVVLNQTSQIINDIEDVNNNYYYNKTTNLTELESNSSWYNDISYTDQVVLNIVPKKTNYFVINYVPLVDAEKYDGDTRGEYNCVNYMTSQNEFTTSDINITGTNVIPDSDYEVIDIPGLMWQILTMPFAFVSQAFNLTLFPGTPYQLNISNLFLSIVAVVVFVWLITFILKMKG